MDFGKLQAKVVKNLYKHINNRATWKYAVYGKTSINTKKLYTYRL